jgi:hypothetical protein
MSGGRVPREAERERKAVEFEEEQRRKAALERRWELERQGHVPHTVGDVLAWASFGMDRADAVERRRGTEAAEELGRPIPDHPKLDKYQMQREHAEADNAKETIPATQAGLCRLQQVVTSLASKAG